MAGGGGQPPTPPPPPPRPRPRGAPPPPPAPSSRGRGTGRGRGAGRRGDGSGVLPRPIAWSHRGGAREGEGAERRAPVSLSGGARAGSVKGLVSSWCASPRSRSVASLAPQRGSRPLPPDPPAWHHG